MTCGLILVGELLSQRFCLAVTRNWPSRHVEKAVERSPPRRAWRLAHVRIRGGGDCDAHQFAPS
jgi:hypothetical protein